MQIDRLVYLTSFEYPTKFAHPVHALEMARTFNAILGKRFLFVVGSVANTYRMPGMHYSGILPVFWKYIRTFHIRMFFYCFRIPYICVRHRMLGRRNVVFCNDVRLALIALMFRPLFRYRLIYEVHGLYQARAQRVLWKHSDLVVFTTGHMEQYAHALYPNMRSVVAQNAVDITRYQSPLSVKEARASFGLPEKFTIGYVGRFKPLGIDKGVPFLISAMRHMPTVQLLLVGGTPQELQDAAMVSHEHVVSENVHTRPFVDHSLVPRYLWACDVLAYVPSDVASIFHQTETSPMKLFEYMAAQRPIIASDTPAIREILDESCAYLIKPGDTQALVSVVQDIQRQYLGVQEKVSIATERVLQHTWEERTRSIMDCYFANGL